jgi:hypothetical protein
MGRAQSHLRVVSKKSTTCRSVTRPAGRTRQVFPRYVAIGNAKKVDHSRWLIDGRVSADFDSDGELIGVEIIG